MWNACALIALGACGSAPPPSPLAGMNVSLSHVEWRAPASDPQHVDVEIVVDGVVAKLGSVEATPETCAIRTAAAKATELVCGDSTFDANLEAGYLLVTRAGTREVRRMDTGDSVAISVAPYQIPEPETGSGSGSATGP